MSNNERVMYEIVKRRGIVGALLWSEYEAAAKAVVAGIPPETVTPIEQMLAWIELTILENRRLKN